jgi:diguanylate cyclase (GGDEF)-like protein
MSSNALRLLGPSRELAGKAGGGLLLAGAALVLVTVLLPPAAVHSDGVILILGAIAGLAGAGLLFLKSPGEPILGAAAVLGTAVITGATYEAGLAGTGADDNSILYLWVCLYSFYFFRLRHALAQLAFAGIAYGALLIAEAPAETVLTRWLTTMVTLTVAGLLVARLRRSVQGSVDELTRQARLDPLTGALNRSALTERAAIEFARAERDRTPTAVIEIDIDQFKKLNDSHGHPAGDEVLQRVARALREETRQSDVVARVGGDEFAVLLPTTSADEARLIAERLRASAQAELAAGGTVAALSVGVATTDGPPALDFDQLWAAADAAMYEAKRSGGDGVRIAPGAQPKPSIA